MSVLGDEFDRTFKDGYQSALDDLLTEMFGDCRDDSFLRDTYFSNLKWHQTITKLRDKRVHYGYYY